MATVANREGTTAVAKGLGGCAAVGTFFSIIDTIRNHNVHNFTSVCIFGFACWALLKVGSLIKRPSFANVAQVQLADTVLGRRFGAPAWIRPALWAGLFIVMICLLAVLFRYRFGLQGGAFKIAFMAVFVLYLLACQRAERLTRIYLRGWYPDGPQVAIGAPGLWITGTEIPWTAIRAISHRTRRLKVIGVDTIVVEAQAAKGVELIEIDLSDSVEDAQDLYAKLRSAAAAHGANLLPEGQASIALSERLRDSRERARVARQKLEEWRATLPQEIAKTEAQLEDVTSRIGQSETKIRELEGKLLCLPEQRERTETQLEQARKSLRASISLRDSLAKLLATQRNALDNRR